MLPKQQIDEIALAMSRSIAEKSIDEIYDQYQDFSWTNPDTYAMWLAQTYYYVRHASRLLALAASRCDFDHEWMHCAMLKGIREEQGHEMLALNDLKALGYSIENLPELAETTAYHQALFASLYQDGSVALLGFFLPLEGLAAKKLRRDWSIIERSYPKSATTFLKVHLALDVGHYDEGIDSLKGFNLSELSIVNRHLKYSSDLYKNIVKGIKMETLAMSKDKKRRA